jgi:FkbM family methyltransferase
MVLQGPLRGARWIAGSSNHGCWLGSYEHDKAQRFAASVRAGDVVYDIGAHVGYYTLLSARMAGSSGKVFAFEPLPRNARYLERHVELNEAKNVTIIEAAVTDETGTSSFVQSPTSLEGRISPEGGLTVETVSLDDLLTSGRIAPPNVVKIDVEGAEALVLAGASAVLERYRPLLFLAIHGESARVKCGAYLRSVGYVFEALDGLGLDHTSEILARSPHRIAEVERLT